MTIQRAKDYFDHPNECPFCYSEEIESQHSIHEKHNDVVHCNKCLKVWYVVGQLVDDIVEANWLWTPGQTEPEPQ
jgi:transcription elongation factor Elf1